MLTMQITNAARRSARFIWQNTLPWVLVIGGLIGLLSSFALTYDKLQVLQNPDYKPSCSINPVLSCGSVMDSPQAEVFGIPNPIFGLIAFTSVLTFGVLLLAGAKLSAWVWRAAQVAALGGVIFMHYLFFQSVYVINAICPWCFVVWMITIAMFWGITMYNLRSGYLGKWNDGFTKFIERHSALVLAAWYLGIFTILLIRFWYFWSTLI